MKRLPSKMAHYFALLCVLLLLFSEIVMRSDGSFVALVGIDNTDTALYVLSADGTVLAETVLAEHSPLSPQLILYDDSTILCRTGTQLHILDDTLQLLQSGTLLLLSVPLESAADYALVRRLYGGEAFVLCGYPTQSGSTVSSAENDVGPWASLAENELPDGFTAESVTPPGSICITLDDADITALRRLFYDTKMQNLTDTTVIDIITEELSYYTNGIRSRGEAQAIIQSRVSIYLAEQS